MRYEGYVSHMHAQPPLSFGSAGVATYMARSQVEARRTADSRKIKESLHSTARQDIRAAKAARLESFYYQRKQYLITRFALELKRGAAARL